MLQSGSPPLLAGTAGPQDGRAGAEVETAAPAPGWFSRVSSTICAALWMRRKAIQGGPLASHLQPLALSQVSQPQEGKRL